jgi:hypothetical protein
LAVAAMAAMAPVKVAVGQMTSIGDAEKNFSVCADLVEQARTVRAAVHSTREDSGTVSWGAYNLGVYGGPKRT